MRERDLVVTLVRTMTYNYKWIYNYIRKQLIVNRLIGIGHGSH